MDLLDRKFTTQSVALATNAKTKDISNWASLGHIIGQREPIGTGRSRQFSWFNVMEIAIAVELMGIGVRTPQAAFDAARKFAHSGKGPSGWVGDPPSDTTTRIPGLPFHHSQGFTYLFVWGGGSKVVLSENGDVDLNSISPASHHATGFIVVNTLEVFAQVLRRMALDYREVLDEAYED